MAGALQVSPSPAVRLELSQRGVCPDGSEKNADGRAVEVSRFIGLDDVDQRPIQLGGLLLLAAVGANFRQKQLSFQEVVGQRPARLDLFGEDAQSGAEPLDDLVAVGGDLRLVAQAVGFVFLDEV